MLSAGARTAGARVRMSRNLAQPPLLPRSASASTVRGGTVRSPSRGMLLFGTVVVLGTLLPLSVLNRAPTACPDTRIEAGEESAQLAVLAQLAQHNEELLRGLANGDNVSSLTDTAPAVRKEEAPPDHLAVAAAAQGGGAPPVRTAPSHYSAPGIWLRMAIISVGRKDNSEYLQRTLALWQGQDGLARLGGAAADCLGLLGRDLSDPDRTLHPGRPAAPPRAHGRLRCGREAPPA